MKTLSWTGKNRVPSVETEVSVDLSQDVDRKRLDKGALSVSLSGRNGGGAWSLRFAGTNDGSSWYSVDREALDDLAAALVRLAGEMERLQGLVDLPAGRRW